jgi:multidrug efflux pump subunit AcrB
MREGYGKVEAAIKGTQQIAWAVVSSTATTVLAFVPIIMMKNITGDFIRSMPATVVYTLTASLLVSLMLTPYLSSKIIKVEQVKRESKFRRSLNKLIEGSYRKRLGWALNNPKLVVVIAVLVFGGSLFLFPLVGVSFFPKAEKPQFLININAPIGTSIDKTNEFAKKVENFLKTKDEIKTFSTNVGRGNPRIYYNIFPKNESANHAQIFVELKERDAETFSNLISEIREESKTFAGAKIEVKEFEQGPPVNAPIEIRVIGETLAELQKISQDVEKIITSTKGTLNIDNPLTTTRTDLKVNINRAKAGMFGVPIVEIDKTVRAAMAGLSISDYRDENGKEYNVVVRLPVNEKTVVSDFDKIYVGSVTGANVPLKQLAGIEFQASPMEISHYYMERNVNITSDVQTGYSVDAVTNEILDKLKNYDLPKGYRFYAAGELEKRDESFGGMMTAMLIAIIGIFGVLVLQFRSFSQPLIVFSAIPLAIIGSIVALLITGFSFSFTAFVGLTSLVGIVVNNSIILVDYTNQLRLEGKELIEALKEACETRFVPIILTTATTVGGLLPLTLAGGTLWAPMGWTIIGGLIASTVLTLLVVPVLYKLYTPSKIS